MQANNPGADSAPVNSVDADLHQWRLRAHAATGWSAAGASALVGLLLAWALPLAQADGLGRAAVAPHFVAWALALVTVIVCRLRLSRAWLGLSDAAAPSPGHVGRVGRVGRLGWLTQFRGVITLHGVVWGAAAWLPASLANTGVQAVLLTVLAGLVFGAVSQMLFDLRAAALFAVPALLPLVLRLASLPGPLPVSTWVVALMALLLLGMLAVSAHRLSRARRALVSTRRAQADSTQSAREAEQLLRMIFDHAGQGIMMFDPALRLCAWNADALRCTGLDGATVRRGDALRDVLHAMARRGEFGAGPAASDAQAAAEADRRQAVLADAPPGTSHWRRPNGRMIELRRSPVPDGGFVVFYVDVTERETNRLAQSEQQRKLALVLAHTEQGFWSIDNRWFTTDANPAMCRMLGCTLAELMGRSIYDFVDAAQAQVFGQQAARRDQGQAGGYEITLRRPDGGLVHCFNNATPILDQNGHKVGAMGLFSDISAQKRDELQLRQAGELLAQKTQVLEHTLENISQGVLHVDPQGRCIAWNHRFLELLEIPPAWMQGDGLGPPRYDDLRRYQLAQGHLGERLERLDAVGRQLVERFLRGEPDTDAAAYQRVRHDGLVLGVASQRSPDGGMVRTYADITEHTRAQLALTAARDDAERANRAKSAFLSRMSHELRTPMNAILGFGQLLAADGQDPLSPAQQQRVAALLRGGRHLLALIDDVLAIASIEAGRLALQMQPVDLAALATECLELMQPVAQDRGVRLALQLPPSSAPRCTVQADPTRLRQVLLNLLSNAIKFNREGGQVRLCVRVVDQDVRVEVADQGPGIAAEHLPRLFQPFERLDRDGSTEGSGIGLALSHSLVALMQGEMGVHSPNDQGSVFWLRLPIATAAASAPAPAPARAVQGVRPSVLYIEDNPVNLLLMEGMLAHRPQIDLHLAELPEQGLALAARQPPDLVLLDIQLPGMDGFEVLRRLRALPGLAALPVVAVSANAMPADLALAEQAGFDAYLSKPVDMARLLALVDAAFSDAAPPRLGGLHKVGATDTVADSL